MQNKLAKIVLLSLFLIMLCCTLSCTTRAKFSMVDVYSGFYTIAEEYVKLEKYDKAIEFYEKALPGYQDSNELKNKLAYYYSIQGNYVLSEKYFLELLAQDQENISLKSNLAYIYCKQDKFDQAQDLYKEIINNNEFDEISYKNYILLLDFIGQKEEAKKLVQSYIIKFPQDETIHTLLQKEEPKTEETEKDASEEDSTTQEDSESQGDSTEENTSVEGQSDSSKDDSKNDSKNTAE